MTIAQVADQLCSTVTDAVCRYAEISGENPLERMPEYFVSSFVFDHLQRTATLETNFKKLSEWDRDATLDTDPITKSMKAAGDGLRTDLVLFTNDLAKTRQEQRLFALVEFKLRMISDADRAKIISMMRHLKTCKYGLICSVVFGRPEDWSEAEQAAKDRGDTWIARQILRLPDVITDALTVCISYFDRKVALSAIGL